MSADYYDGIVDDAHDKDDEDIDGYNINLRWDRYISETSSFYIQTYFNHFYRLDGESDDPSAILREIDIFDIDMVYSTIVERHDLTLGGGYRYSKDDTNKNSRYSVIPDSRQDDIYSLFIQDKITLYEDKLFLTLGTKIEHNDYTGLEVQPTARLLHNLDQEQIIWGAIIGTNRLPSRIESDDRRRGALDIDAEEAISYELGHRFISDLISLDSSLFYVDYDEMIAINNDGSNSGIYDNIFEGKIYGLELTATFNVSDNWRVSGSYSLLKADLKLKDGFIDRFNSVSRFESVPENQFNIHSNWDISDNLEFDVYYYYVDDLKHNVDSGTGEGVDSYSRVDIRFGWRYNHFDLSVGVQNVFEAEHIEFSTTSRTATAVERNIYAQLTFKY